MPDITPITTTYGSKIPVNTAGNGGDGKIHPFQVPFEDANKKGIGAQAQAAQILADMQAMLKKNPNAKIAITYSANNDQSEDLIKSYETGNYGNNLGGGNQANTFLELSKMIKANGLSDQIHILPVSTCLHPITGTGDLPVTQEIVKRDAQNIAKHLGAEWIVLGLQNQPQDVKKPITYPIGTGLAKQVWKGQLQANMNTALEQMTAGVETISNDPLGLKAAYQAGKQNPSALLLKQQPTAAPAKQSPPPPVAQQKTPPAPQPDLDSEDTTEPPKPAALAKKFADVAETFSPPKPPIIAANDMSQYKWDKFKDSNDNFQFKKLDDSSEDYLGSIMSKKADEPLVNITKTGLQCLQLSDPSQKAEQTNAIVAGLQYMATNRTKDFNDPLIIEARGDFNVEQLQAIMKKLQEDKSPIRFQENVKNSPEIKKLITEYNSEYTKTNSPTPQPTVPPEQLPREPKKSSKPH